VDVTNGGIICHSLFIGEQYTGKMIESNGDPIGVYSSVSDIGKVKRIINKKTGIFNLKEILNVKPIVDIMNAPDGSTYDLGNSTSGNFHVGGSRGRLELVGNTNPVITNRSRTVTLSGADTNAKIVKSAVITAGALSFVVHDSRWKNTGNLCEQVSPPNIISGRSSVQNLSGDDIDGNIEIYGGRLHYTDNANVAINADGTGGVTVWKGGIYDTRTSGTNQLADTIVAMQGGNFVAGAGTSVTISTT